MPATKHILKTTQLILSAVLIFISPSLIYGSEQENRSVSSDHSSKIHHLSPEALSRLSQCKKLLDGVDGKSYEQSRWDLEQSSHPRENLAILEAVAKTYSEIVQEQHVQGKKKKEWLHSMITLNMAYLQLAGFDSRQSQDSDLDKLIRRKLKKYLPAELKDHSDIFYSLE